jgi:hypothetical protein
MLKKFLRGPALWQSQSCKKDTAYVILVEYYLKDGYIVNYNSGLNRGRSMKRVFALLMCFAFSGCVSTYVIKEIQVKKDANGKVIETTETERVIQEGVTKGFQFDYLKNKQSDKTPAVIYY